MDVITRSETKNGKTAEIRIENGNRYRVTLWNEDGRSTKSNIYGLSNKKAATACFSRYKKEVNA